MLSFYFNFSPHSLDMLLISCYVDLTLWHTVLLFSCLASLSFPSVACSYSPFAVDILPICMLNDIKDFVCYPARYFGRLLFNLVKRQTRWRHYLRDVVFPTFYHQNLKIPQISQFQQNRLYYDMSVLNKNFWSHRDFSQTFRDFPVTFIKCLVKV